MNRWINNELKALEAGEEGAIEQGREPRLQFMTNILEQTVFISELKSTDATTCIICQLALFPAKGETWAAEDAVRIPCGHILGQKCARKWFGSLVAGRYGVDEDFNTICPICRASFFDVGDTEALGEENCQLWITFARKIHSQILEYRIAQEKTMRYVEEYDCIDRILDVLDKLALTRWYVFRRFESNPREALNAFLMREWNEKEPEWTLPGPATSDELLLPPEDVKKLGERVRRALIMPDSIQDVCNAHEEPESRILRGYAHAEMAPSMIWRGLVTAYTGITAFGDHEVEDTKLEMLDILIRTMRRVDPQVDPREDLQDDGAV